MSLKIYSVAYLSPWSSRKASEKVWGVSWELWREQAQGKERLLGQVHLSTRDWGQPVLEPQGKKLT